MSVLLADPIQRRNEASERCYRNQLRTDRGVVSGRNAAYSGQSTYSPFVRRLLNESVFREAMFSLNETLQAEGERGIPLSYARQLHEEFITTGMSYFSDDTLTAFNMRKTMPIDMDNITASNFANALRAFIKDKTGRDDLDCLSNDGLSKIAGDVRQSFARGFAPLSPYDSRFFMCEWALSSNGSAVYAPVGDKDNGNGGMSLCNASGIPYMDTDMNAFYERIPLYASPNADSMLGEDGRVVTPNSDTAPMVLRSENDLYGLSYLHRYVPQKNPESIESIDRWVKSSGFPMSETAIRSSVAILHHLNDKGVSYTIEPDTSYAAGHVNAVTANKTHIRITSPSNYENNIGRCYNGGLVYYASTDQTVPDYELGQDGRYRLEDGKKIPKVRTGKDGRQWQGEVRAEYMIPIEDRLAVVDYAVGVTPDVANLGEFGSYNTTMYSRQARMNIPSVRQNSFYHTTKQGHRMFRADVKPLPNRCFVRRNNRNQALGIDGLPISYATSNKPAQMSTTNKVHMIVDNKRRYRNISFSSAEEANQFIMEAVDSAKLMFASSVDIDRLLDEADTHGMDYTPVFDEDSVISSVQQSFWALIRQAQEDDGSSYDRELTKERLMSQLSNQFMPERIGYYNSPDDCLINPLLVSRYMTTTNTTGDISHRALSAAFLAANVSRDKFKGEGSSFNAFCEGLVQFDEASQTSLKNLLDSYQDGPQKEIIQSVCDSLTNAITATGCDFDLSKDAFIDDNGIIKYKARRIVVDDLNKSMTGTNISYEPVEGTIGQVFLPDGMGLIETKFNHDDNYLFVPDYEADILPQKPGENKTYEERLCLRGYADVLHDFITARVRSDIVKGVPDFESNTALNRTYRMLRSERFPLNILEKNKRTGMSPELFDDKIYTLSRRFHLPSIYGNSTIRAASLYALSDRKGLANDLNITDPFVRSGFEDISILTDNGYTSKTVTSVNSSMGLNRCLSDGAVLQKRGQNSGHLIVPTDDEELKETRLVRNHMPYAQYSPTDRDMMRASNLLSCRRVAPAVGAFATIGCYTMNDSVLFSKRFAEENGVEGVNAVLTQLGFDDDKLLDSLDDAIEMRSLMSGDKASVGGGNKATAARIVDTDMPERNAMYSGHYMPWKLFKDNPSLDFVMSPQTFPGRFDGYTTREAMDGYAKGNVPDGGVLHIDGKDIPGALCRLDVIINEQTADSKLHVYDAHSGKGRSASAQLTAALIANNAKSIVREFKGSDVASFERLRESLIPLGFDVDEYGNAHLGYSEHEGEERKVVRLPELQYTTNENGERIVDKEAMRNEMFSQLNSYGGFIEVPFQMTLPSGMPLMESYGDDGQPNGNYLLPLLPPYLRSGFDSNGDGPDIYHGYTYAYQRILMNSLEYKALQENQSSVDDFGKMNSLRASIEKEYRNSITNDLEARVFHSKHGLFKQTLARPLPNSATVVWVANPSCKIEEITMGAKMAERLGFVDGDYAMIWRDPILSDGGIRAPKIHIDSDYEDVVGVSPLLMKSLAGDFDGDTIGITKIKGKQALDELIRNFGVVNNALDTHYVAEDGKFDLYYDTGLDIQAVCDAHPELGERLSALRDKFNDDYHLRDENYIEWMATNEKHFEEFNDWYIDAQEADCGINVIQFDSLENNLRSVAACIENGSKGKPDSFDKYCRYLGVTFDAERDEDGRIRKDADGKLMIDYSTIKDEGHTLSTWEDRVATQTALSAKNQFTGSYGKQTQHIITATLGAFFDGPSACEGKSACRAGINISEGMTQSALSAKHNVEQARRLIHNVLTSDSPLKALWAGKAIKTSVNADGNPIWIADEARAKDRLSPEEWKKQFTDFATSPFGCDAAVNPEYMDLISRAMTLTDNKGNKYIGSIERVATHRSEILEQAYHPNLKSFASHIAEAGGSLNIYGIDVNAIKRQLSGIEDASKAKETFDKALNDGNVAYVYAPELILWNIAHDAAPEAFNQLHSKDKRVQSRSVEGDYQTQAVAAKATSASVGQRPRIQTPFDLGFHSVSKASDVPNY